MSRIALIGGGGFAKEIAEVAVLTGHEIAGYVADQEGVLRAPYWGPREALAERADAFDSVFIGFGAVDRRSLARRAEMIAWIKQSGLTQPALISPNATVSAGATVGPGAFIAHGVVVSVDATIGAFAILNSSAIVGHDAIVGDGVIVAPGAFLGGNATIGANSLIGPGALVLEGRTVGAQVIVGLGGTVVRPVADGATVMPLRTKSRA